MGRPKLWSGADVRWVGSQRRRRGVELRPGDRAVVVDAGRHHVGSFGTMSRGDVRPKRGVVIRVEDGVEVRVARRDVELVAPDHPLRPEPDSAVADWWIEQLDEWGATLPVAAFVPRSLPAVCRVLHPWWDRRGDRVTWRDVADVTGAGRAELASRLARRLFEAADGLDDYQEPHEGELDDGTARSLVTALSSATSTPDDVFVAVWQGWGDIPPQKFPGAALLATPHRGHFLLRGPLHGVTTSIAASRAGARPVSGLWWPADRAWFVATEIDLPWTFVAADESTIGMLLSNEDLETMRSSHDSKANTLDE